MDAVARAAAPAAGRIPHHARPGHPARASPRPHGCLHRPSIRAVLATVGGDDQLPCWAHLDPAVVRAHPKAFFGYSDNTNLLNWLWNHGIAGWHGGSTMVHLGPGPTIDPVHLRSLRAALFGGGDVPIEPLSASRDYGMSWEDPRSLVEPASGRTGHRGLVVARPAHHRHCDRRGAATWRSLSGRWRWAVMSGPAQAYAGCLLLLETSEEHPDAVRVFRMLRNLGERGVLGQVAGIVVARAAACERHDDPGPVRRAAVPVRAAGRRSCSAADIYAPGVPVWSASSSGIRARSGCCPTAGW